MKPFFPEFAGPVVSRMRVRPGIIDPIFDDVVIYLTYTPKNQMRWHIANDVTPEVTDLMKKEMKKLELVELNT